MLNVPQSEKTEQSTDNENSFHLSPPSLSLPQGGGALKGIGEKFSANPVTGTGSMAVPIATSPGRGGFGPQLALTYDSGAGNGPFGFGWNLSLPSITRKTDKGLPRYWDAEESDVFLLSGAEDLVPVAESGLATRAVAGNIYQIQRYRPRVEGLFVRIERWTNVADSQEVFWRSLSRDNISTWYGKDADSRIADTANPSHIFSWLICESHDDKGNVMVYRYQAENSDQVDLTQVHERNRTDESRSANRYLKSIRYGNHAPYLPVLSADASWPAPPGTDAAAASEDWFFEVVFDYGEHHRANPQPNDAGAWTLRADPFSAYRAGFEVRTYRLCRRVLMFHHFPGETGVGRNCLVRSTDFTYTDERSRIYTFLSAVQQRGYKRQGDEGYLTKSLPPVEFTYTMPQIDDTVQTVAPSSLENLPDGLDGARYQWVDLDGEGVTGILTEQGGGWFYKRNLSPINRAATATEPVTARFAPIERVSQKPPMGIAAGSQFMDLAGDGQLDLVTLRGATPGFYERTRDGEDWESFRAFRSLPVMDWDNPNLKFIDLDGDGHSDILITEDDCFMWHRSLAEEGFGDEEKAPQPWDEEKGPRVVFADGTQSIYLADLSGDGLTDIVRIRNGEVCYWPNQGYGRFGAKVTMDNAPWFDAPDQFSQDRIQLADIDGSGTTDILYLGGNGVQIYFNESGNHWADKQVLHSFPAIDNLAAVTVVDLLGTGTACLVWSSPLPGHQGRAMSYIELMGGEQIVERIDGSLLRLRGQKPHLLIQTRNNLGAETLVQYAPSTKFYLQDKLAGTPWITKLPFPIHVVEKVKVTDKWRQTTFSSTYSYHHGYFDGIEREFRGFGRVEQTDVEDFGQFTAGNRASPYIADDQTLYQPPVKTITWFHTGAFLDRQRILSQFQTEYFAPSSDDFTEATLPEPDLTTHDLSVEEWREALRACKGMMLRQEVYELDVDALANDGERRVKLFSTAFHNCHIQRLQARGEHRHAVFLVTESEAITYHYELDLRPESLQPDPRIAHTLNLSIDEVGNVLESVAVAYPRLGRHTDSTLPEGTEDLIEAVQQERHLVLTENRFTHDVMGDDAYRLRLPCEVKTYELTGINPEKSFYYTLAGVQAAVSGAALAEILYHVVPDRTTPQKRGVEWVRMLYFNDDLETPLPWGEINSLALPYETYKLALTDDLLSAVFETEYLTAEVRGNLNDPDESGYLSFDTSGQYWVRSGVAGFDTRTETHAATHFYLPERYTDAFGNTTTLSYDSRDLYVASSTDPVGNTTQVRQFDFRVLAPAELEDINGNRSQVYFDVLGLPTAMAMLGKGTDADGLSGFDDALANPDLADLTAFFNGGVYNEAQARQWLGSATARYVYHFGETAEADGNLTWGAQPAAACSIMREQHHAALEPGQISPLQVGFEYSDGMGTVLVQKVQAEPDPDDDSDNPPLRWIANGKTILNNKGNPVKQYEPYFSPS
ncbi:MAG: SpvB/TcaC N-terminal domain-containing protein, partial [Cyanobacteria bacterium P01_D01_bin.115]